MTVLSLLAALSVILSCSDAIEANSRKTEIEESSGQGRVSREAGKAEEGPEVIPDSSGAELNDSRAESDSIQHDVEDAAETRGADISPPTLVCPEFVEGAMVGEVTHPMLTEISGLAASRTWPDVLWAHNDSGDVANLYAFSTTGEHLGIYQLPIAKPWDCEALSLGPGETGEPDRIYLADIGDNLKRRDSIFIHIVTEPVVPPPDRSPLVELDEVTTHEFVFADGAGHDAEAYFWDPVDSQHVIVEKVGDTTATVFAATTPAPGTKGTFDPVAVVPLGLATAADIALDGSQIVIKSYFETYLWLRPQGFSLGEVFSATGCPIPMVVEPQGEAIGFAPAGKGYYTVSEGALQPIYFYSSL